MTGSLIQGLQNRTPNLHKQPCLAAGICRDFLSSRGRPSQTPMHGLVPVSRCSLAWPRKHRWAKRQRASLARRSPVRILGFAYSLVMNLESGVKATMRELGRQACQSSVQTQQPKLKKLHLAPAASEVDILTASNSISAACILHTPLSPCWTQSVQRAVSEACQSRLRATRNARSSSRHVLLDKAPWSLGLVRAMQVLPELRATDLENLLHGAKMLRS